MERSLRAVDGSNAYAIFTINDCGDHVITIRRIFMATVTDTVTTHNLVCSCGTIIDRGVNVDHACDADYRTSCCSLVPVIAEHHEETEREEEQTEEQRIVISSMADVSSVGISLMHEQSSRLLGEVERLEQEAENAISEEKYDRLLRCVRDARSSVEDVDCYLSDAENL